MDGREVTSWFSKEGDLTFSTNSFYGKTEGYENEMVQVLEDSILYFIPIAELEALCLKYADIANWLRILHQKPLWKWREDLFIVCICQQRNVIMISSLKS